MPTIEYMAIEDHYCAAKQAGNYCLPKGVILPRHVKAWQHLAVVDNNCLTAQLAFC